MTTQPPQMLLALMEIKKKNYFFPEIIVDIGACTGTNGLYGVFTDPAPKYLLIEPLEEFNAKLHKFMHGKNYEIVNCCLSSEPGTASFKVDPSMKDSSHIIEKDSKVSTKNADVLTVPIDTLDNVINKDGATSGVDMIIKIDVQGVEPGVIEGGIETIKNNNCLLIVEVGTRRDNSIKIFSLLDSLGYKLVDCIDFVKFKGADKVTSQFDAIFMRA